MYSVTGAHELFFHGASHATNVLVSFVLFCSHRRAHRCFHVCVPRIPIRQHFRRAQKLMNWKYPSTLARPQ